MSQSRSDKKIIVYKQTRALYNMGMSKMKVSTMLKASEPVRQAEKLIPALRKAGFVITAESLGRAVEIPKNMTLDQAMTRAEQISVLVGIITVMLRDDQNRKK
jgi:hypothetical protein